MNKSKILKAFSWDFLGVVSQQGMGFIISIFLARILSPAEFGLVGMAMVFISFSQVFSNFGFSSALIQRLENTNEAYSTIFFLNISIGFFLCLIFQIISVPIASFYGQAEVEDIVRLLSLNLVFASFSQVQMVHFKRKLNFKALTIRSLLAQFFAGSIGVFLAFKGYGVYALVVQSILNSFFNAVLIWALSPWRPSFHFSISEMKQLFGFSFYRFLDSIVSTAFKKLDILFVAKAFDATTLGLYTRADSLKNLVARNTSTTFSKVFFPVLSKLQNDDESFSRLLLKALLTVSFVGFLLTGLVMIWGKQIILGLFGPQWKESVPIFQITILFAIALPINALLINALVSKGFARENLLFGLLRKAVYFSAIIVGFIYGFVPFLWALLVVNYFLVFVNCIYIGIKISIKPSKILKSVFRFIPVFLILALLFFNFNLGAFGYVNLTILSFAYLLFFGLYFIFFGGDLFEYVNRNKAHFLAWKKI